MMTTDISAIGGPLPLHPRLLEHGMTRDNGRVVGSVRAGAQLISLSVDRMAPDEKAEVRAQLLKGRS